MRRSSLLRALAFLCLAPFAPVHGMGQAVGQTTHPTEVILVRHAEKASIPGDDPPLSTEGEARARALAAALRDAGVTAIVATSRRRTQETAHHVASARGLQPEIVPLGPTVAAHVANVANAVRHHSGGVVLVVGHSNTIPAIIAALGGPHMPDLCDSEYSDLFVMTLDGQSAPRLVRAYYGASDSPATASCAGMQAR